MADIKEFVVNDRRKFTAEGDIRPDAPPSEPKTPRPETVLQEEPTRSSERPGPQAVPSLAPTEVVSDSHEEAGEANETEEPLPQPPTAEQTEQAKRAFDATVDRLDTAIRATNPGMDHPPELNFERVIHSLYMQAMLQLGGAAAPGQKPQLDIMGARQTIDMIAILADKTKGNLTTPESILLDAALFELHMGFLEVTQALARQAAARQPGTPGSSAPNGPSIVR